jgi:hypothetical protein
VITGPVNQIFLFASADPCIEYGVHNIPHLTIYQDGLGHLAHSLARRVNLQPNVVAVVILDNQDIVGVIML